MDLNERERKIIEYIRVNKRITSSEIQQMFNVSRVMANRYMKRLQELLIIERKGAGKAVYYIKME
ncbi:hypothetical protein A2Y85_02310 [candidate division WOR-3 bacterium RBG_13_43_14]|uniref:HTH arsR-type domain-containing protein n=1 Tax=candidate division WOR-3 bacterium RBG_13_43_14 TaxID=1802590 RepID=A0A1F4UD84_UNCW3|nr:MAG: hypothetical protein A2Y85_02310 [candidate division WOR-3 bacterium RBG_13_43_14]